MGAGWTTVSCGSKFRALALSTMFIWYEARVTYTSPARDSLPVTTGSSVSGQRTARSQNLRVCLQSGGSFGKPAAVVEAKRTARKLELAALDAALRDELGPEQHSGHDELFVCGDFNCDSNFILGVQESGCGELWPEVELLPDRALPDVFADAWEEYQQHCKQQGGAASTAASSGCTESQSNLMRAVLKPGQAREARFDKVVVARERVRVRSVELVGTEQCGEVNDGGTVIPLSPSDHFGVLVLTDDVR